MNVHVSGYVTVHTVHSMVIVFLWHTSAIGIVVKTDNPCLAAGAAVHKPTLLWSGYGWVLDSFVSFDFAVMLVSATIVM